MKNILFLFFTVTYFFIFCKVIDFLFQNSGIDIVANILVVVCWIVSFVVSVGLAEFTVKKIEVYFKNET